jgi:putative protein-disulfide isomerase
MTESLTCDENGLCSPENQQGAHSMEQITTDKETSTIWYFGDPMCSWCWGISEEISSLVAHYKGRLKFEMVMGGLRPDGGDEWNDEFKEFLRKHWNHVNRSSGQAFSYDILKTDHFDYNTEPPSRAVVVIKIMYPEKAFDFLKKVSRKFYVGNQDPGEDIFYKSICEEMDIDYSVFLALYQSQKFKSETFNEFRSAKDYGVQGFPTILFEHKKRFTVITRGYNSADRMIERIDYVLNKDAKGNS